MGYDLLKQIIQTNVEQRKAVRRKIERSLDNRKIPFSVKNVFYQKYECFKIKTLEILNIMDEERFDDDLYDEWVIALRDFDNFTYDVIVETYKVKGDI